MSRSADIITKEINSLKTLTDEEYFQIERDLDAIWPELRNDSPPLPCAVGTPWLEVRNADQHKKESLAMRWDRIDGRLVKVPWRYIPILDRPPRTWR